MIEKLRDCFDEMVVYKDLKKSNFFSALGLPSFLRDWLLKKFADDEFVVNQKWIDADGITILEKEHTFTRFF